MKNPIPGIDSFAQEEALFDAKRKKIGPIRPYPTVYGQKYKGKITSDGFDTRVKVCDVETPIDDLKDCTPMCFVHPDRLSRGVVNTGRMVRRQVLQYWTSACDECLTKAEMIDQLPTRRHL